MHKIQKAVLALLFLFFTSLGSAQIIKIEAFEENSLQPIEFFSVTAFKNGKQKSVSNRIAYSVLQAYDSVLIQAFGYKNKWISDFSLPRITNPEKTVPFGVLLTPLTTDINEVIISAGKFEEKKKDIAREITVIKAQDIAFQSPSNTADVLQNSGAVLVQKSQLGGGSPIIRGFEANKVQIVIDGVRMNNAIYRGGHLQNVLRIDNNILERVEIIQGAGSVIYGSDALGGIMHFVTKAPKLNTNDTTKVLFGVNANTRYGSAANELTGSFNFNFGWEKVALFSSFSFSQFGNLRQGATGLNGERAMWEKNYITSTIRGRDTMLVNTDPLVQFGSGYTQLDFLQKVLIKTGEKVSHSINFQYSTTGEVPRYDRLNQTDSARNADIEANRFAPESLSNPFRFAEWYYGPETRMLLAYSLNLKKSKEKGLNNKTQYEDFGRVTVAWQNIEESRHTRRFQSLQRTDRRERVQVGSINADFELQKGRNEIRYGGELIFNSVSSKGEQVNINSGVASPAISRYPQNGSSMLLGAVYTTLNRELRKGFILNAGLRYNLVSLQADFGDTSFTKFPFTTASQFNTALNGNIGLVYNSPKGWRLSGLLSSAFRAPNVDDLGKVFDSNPNDSIVIVPNSEIEPELTYNAELSISKLLGDNGIVSITGWYTWYRRAIVIQPFSLNGANTIFYDGIESRVFANQNQRNAYLYGANINVKWSLTKKMAVNGTANYTYGRIETDSVPYPLAHIPPVFGRLGVQWVEKYLQFEVFSLFNGAKRLEDYNVIAEDNFYQSTVNGMPAWYTLNFRGSYQLSPFSQLQVSIENILDKNYRVFASGISAPGRNVVVTLRAWL